MAALRNCATVAHREMELAAAAPPTAAPAEAGEATSEWAQVRRRLEGGGGGTFQELARGRLAILGVGTSDPDFDQSRLELLPATGEPGESAARQTRRGVLLQVELPQGYPAAGRARVTVVNRRHAIAKYLEGHIQSFLDNNTGRPLLRQLVKWVDRVIGEWRLDPSFSSQEAPSSNADEALASDEEGGGGERQGGRGKQLDGLEEESDDSGEESEESGGEGEGPDEATADTAHESTLSTPASIVATDPWTFAQQEALERALIRYPASLEKHRRWRKVGASVPGKSKAEVVARYERLRSAVWAARGIADPRKAAEEARAAAAAAESARIERHHAEPSAGDDPLAADAAWSAAQQAQLDAALLKFPASMDKNERWKAIGREVEGKGKRECVARFKMLRERLLLRQKEKANECAEAEDRGEPGGVQLPNLQPVEKGVRASLTGLALAGVGWCFAEALDLQVSCSSCGRDAVVAAAAAGWQSPQQQEQQQQGRVWCPECASLLSVRLRPALAHAQSGGLVGFLDCSGCVAQDLVSARLQLGCFECGELTPSGRVARARPVEAACRTCHRKLRVAYDGWDAKDLTPTDQSRPWDKFKERAARVARDPRIMPGKPLPGNGACGHYAKSFRWLRFPCCGRAFACDECHDAEQAGKCEPGRWAARQICGFCAHEQPFSKDKPCLHCGKTIGLPRRTRHWQGGQGERDKARMSSKDRQKFSNSSLKTKSRSHAGPKAGARP